MPTTRAPSSRRQARASACSAASGSSTAKTHARPSSRSSLSPLSGRNATSTPGRRRRPRRRPRSPRGRTRRRRRARRAGRRRGRRRRSRRSRSSPARGEPGAALGDDLGAHRGGDLAPASRFMPRRRRQAPRSSSRATSRSSKGILRPSSNSWPCSWPLPAITTVSPGSARARRRARSRRAGRARTSTPPPSPAPARTSAMIASGSSERGLSEVTIARSEPLGAGPPHLRPLVAVAVAAGAEDRDHPALGQPPGGARGRSRASRACGRSRRGRRSPGPRRPARSGRARAAPCARPRGRLAGSTSSAIAAAKAPSALATLKWPGSSVRDLGLPLAADDGEARPGGVEGDVAGARSRPRRPRPRRSGTRIPRPGAGRRGRRR